MNFLDVVNTKGPAAIGPLKSPKPNDPHRVVFYAAFDGYPILTSIGFCDESSFPTEEAALQFATEWAEYQAKLSNAS